jgi:hypothetical protein
MSKRPIPMLIFTCLALFGIVACGSTDTGSSTTTDVSSTTPTSSPALSPTPSVTLTPLQIIGVAIAVNPGGISNIACGSSTNFVFSATITSSSGNAGGQVPYSWNINHSTIPGSVTFAPGETSKTVTYTQNNVVIQLNSASSLGGSITVGSPGKSISSSIGITGVCRLPGPFQVVGLAISTNPSSIAGKACGTKQTVTYNATITIAPNSNGGTVQLVWNIGGYHSSTSVPFAPAQTVQPISITQNGYLGRLKFPYPATIASTSPNAVTSAPAQPGGVCS